MDIANFYLRMRQEVSEFAIGGREESAAFLIWFLENYFRIETQEAIDSVFDHTNDKGIDGIYVDDEDEVIYLFQSKYSPNNDQFQGDNDIKKLIGAVEWFRSEDSLKALLNSVACRELKDLIVENEIAEKISYKLKCVFVTNKRFDTRAKEYIKVAADLEHYDCDDLFQEYTYFADEEISFPKIDLYLTNNTKIEYNLPDNTMAKVYSLRAKELVKLQGIQDRTLFYKNVRYGVGNTRVNKSIKETISTMGEHNNFFLYHNGITIICTELVEDLTQNKISISGYSVINGCQSMLAFFENRRKLSNNLFVLVKIIKLSATSPLIKNITYFANNQNSISLNDLRSNDPVQKTLQKEFEELFGTRVLYKRKRGEKDDGYVEVIEKDFAAQLIEAIYLGNPHDTHLKQKLFGEDYTKIYSRKIKAEKIYLSYILYKTIEQKAELLEIIPIRNYGLAIFFFVHTIAEIIKEDDFGKRLIENPREYVTTHKDVLIKAFNRLWELITPDINFDMNEYTSQNGFFNYKNEFKNAQFVRHMAGKIKTAYIRLVRRDSQYSFVNIYNSLIG